MIIINSAMQQDNIKNLLAGIDQDGISFTFKEKRGIQLVFEATGDKERAVRLAKDSIKATDWGKVLYYNVIAQ